VSDLWSDGEHQTLTKCLCKPLLRSGEQRKKENLKVVWHCWAELSAHARRTGVGSRQKREVVSLPQLPGKLCSKPSLLFHVYWGTLSGGIKRPKREADHSLLLSVQFYCVVLFNFHNRTNSMEQSLVGLRGDFANQEVSMHCHVHKRAPPVSNPEPDESNPSPITPFR
jgi:hypothetical protein